MKSIRILFTACAILALLSSCNKDDDDISIENRQTAILGQWEYESIMSDRAVDLNGDNISNIDLLGTQELKQCEKDNVTTFTNSGPSNKPEFNVTENNLACDNNEPFSFVEEDFWTLTNSNTIISFENKDLFRIIELSKNKLIVETDAISDGLNYVKTIVYRKG